MLKAHAMVHKRPQGQGGAQVADMDPQAEGGGGGPGLVRVLRHQVMRGVLRHQTTEAVAPLFIFLCPARALGYVVAFECFAYP